MKRWNWSGQFSHHAAHPRAGRQQKLSKARWRQRCPDYIRDGYAAGGTRNLYCCSMGWNDGTEQEIFTIGELIDKFSLGKVQRRCSL